MPPLAGGFAFAAIAASLGVGSPADAAASVGLGDAADVALGVAVAVGCGVPVGLGHGVALGADVVVCAAIGWIDTQRPSQAILIFA